MLGNFSQYHSVLGLSRGQIMLVIITEHGASTVCWTDNKYRNKEEYNKATGGNATRYDPIYLEKEVEEDPLVAVFMHLIAASMKTNGVSLEGPLSWILDQGIRIGREEGKTA